MLERGKFYVLGRIRGQHWVLGAYAGRLEAEQAIRWQMAADREGVWVVCEWAGGKFRADGGGAIDMPLRRGCYTREAYGRFLEAHGVDARHMMD